MKPNRRARECLEACSRIEDPKAAIAMALEVLRHYAESLRKYPEERAVALRALHALGDYIPEIHGHCAKYETVTQ